LVPEVTSIMNPSGLMAVVCLTCVVLKAIQLYWRRQKLLKIFKSFPGPPTHWLYGHLQKLQQDDELDNIASWTEQYPHCHPVWVGGFLGFLWINHPEYAKAVFSRGDPKSLRIYSFLVPWIGQGLLILHGPKWFQHRRLLMPGFHYDILKSYVTVMADSVRVMLVGTAVGTVLCSNLLVTGHMAYQTLTLGVDNLYIQTVMDLSLMVHLRIQTPLHHNHLVYWLSSQGRRFHKACRLAHHHTDKVIRERKEFLKDERQPEKIQRRRHLDFLDILLSLIGRIH
uniref:Cytochrome P450, family 4, subfamily T, polypeptide 8 n=1 Tax=Chrysemys picta bellii TaxID=8478 RepID=A0A8C3FQI6_CHRPI